MQIDQCRRAIRNRNKACIIEVTLQAGGNQLGFDIHHRFDRLMPVVGTSDQQDIFACVAARAHGCQNLGKTRIGGRQCRHSRRRPKWCGMLAGIGFAQP